MTGRPLVHPPLPEREIDPSTLAEADGLPKPRESSKPPLQTPDHLKNNHSLFPRSPSLAANPLLASSSSNQPSVDEFLLAKALTPSSVCAPTRLLAPLIGPREWSAEMIYIVRPVIYGTMLYPPRADKVAYLL